MSIPASTLGTNNAIRANILFTGNILNGSIMAFAQYGGGTVASVQFARGANLNGSVSGTIECVVMANQSGTLQRVVLKCSGATVHSSSVFGQTNIAAGTSSVESGAAQTFGITTHNSTAQTQFVYDSGIIERII